MRTVLFTLTIALAGCKFAQHEPLRGRKVPAVTYYDFNWDGRVDYEHHTPRGAGGSDLEWARDDTDYDGYYDTHLGFGGRIVVPAPIRMPVPKVDFAEPKIKDR